MPILQGLSYCSFRVIHSIWWDLVLGLAFWICLIPKTACNEHIFSFYRWNPRNTEIRRLYNSEMKSRLKFFYCQNSMLFLFTTELYYLLICLSASLATELLKYKKYILFIHQGLSTWNTIWHSTIVSWVNEWAHELFDSLYKILLFY